MSRLKTFKEWLSLKLEAEAGGGKALQTSPDMDVAVKAVNQATTDLASAKKKTPEELTSTPQGQSEILKKAPSAAKQFAPNVAPNVGAMAKVLDPKAAQVKGARMKKK